MFIYAHISQATNSYNATSANLPKRLIAAQPTVKPGTKKNESAAVKSKANETAQAVVSLFIYLTKLF
jgi:hypothetical protein